jgi:hypothetical protein
MSVGVCQDNLYLYCTSKHRSSWPRCRLSFEPVQELGLVILKSILSHITWYEDSDTARVGTSRSKT